MSDSADKSVSEIAAFVASRLARNSDNGPPSDYQQDALVDDEISSGGLQTLQPRKRSTSDEYLMRVNSCLEWAREAPNDEIYVACLTLAQSWLRAAIDNRSVAPSRLPPAPTL